MARANTVTKRRAIRRGGEVLAECPHNGVCRYRQAGQRIMHLQCGYRRGVFEDRRGLMVRCARG